LRVLPVRGKNRTKTRCGPLRAVPPADTVSGMDMWDSPTARSLQARARRIFADHGPHDGQLERDNCGACAVAAYTEQTPPNYAGWLRVWIEAGRPVPRQHYETEIAQAQVENVGYYEAILRDVETFGISFV